jgi:hypothetical protein
VGWAPRRLAAAVGFILLLGSVHGFTNGPPAKVWAPTGVVASPRAHRGLQFWWESVESQAHSGAGIAILRAKIWALSVTIYRGFFLLIGDTGSYIFYLQTKLKFGFVWKILEREQILGLLRYGNRTPGRVSRGSGESLIRVGSGSRLGRVRELG